MHTYSLLLFVLINIYCALASSNFVAQTIYGNVTGGLSMSGQQKRWTIRYAASAEGANRWKSPQPVTPWTGTTIDATKLPPACIQINTPASYHGQSEDCLFLTVYVPLNHDLSDPPLPVQVFIHGGSFTYGAEWEYTGDVLAGGNNIIFVSVAYRLGPLGFMVHPALYGPERNDGLGFYGIQDQRAGLQWVQDNIGFFGGNKDAVTVSGESAGALSVCIHLASPRSAGLFSQAIMESGSCHALMSNESALQFYQPIVDGVGCDQTDLAEALTCLLAANATTMWGLMAPQAAAYPALVSTGEITQQPIDILGNGQGQKVPLLIGNNHDEFAFNFCPNYPNLTPLQYNATIAIYFNPNYTIPEVYNLYPLSNYPNPTKALIDLVSDHNYKCVSKNIANLFSLNGYPVYFYAFNDVASYFMNPDLIYILDGTTDVGCMGVAHTYELAFVFNIYEQTGQYSLNATELTLRTTMRDAWSSFVASGSPTLPSMTWPRFEPNNAAYVNLQIGGLSIGYNYRQEYCNFWTDEITVNISSFNASTSTSASTSTTATPSTSSLSSAASTTASSTTSSSSTSSTPSSSSTSTSSSSPSSSPSLSPSTESSSQGQTSSGSPPLVIPRLPITATGITLVLLLLLLLSIS